MTQMETENNNIINEDSDDRNEEITNPIERQGGDGFEWIHFDDNKPELATDNEGLMDTTIDSMPEAMPSEANNKTKYSETNENHLKTNKMKQKSRFSQNNNNCNVFWDFNEFEGLPSQRPYYRI